MPILLHRKNQGKNLFLAPPQFGANGNRTGGGLGCAACHAAPEFDIDPNSKNNGIIGKISGTGIDITNTRAPSLRNITNNVVLKTDNLCTPEISPHCSR